MEDPSPSSDLQPPSPPEMDFSATVDDPAAAAVWDWGSLLDFAIDGDDPLILSWDAPEDRPDPSPPPPPDPVHHPPPSPPPPQPAAPAPPVPAPGTAGGQSRVRKRDPRLVCANYLAGRVPCACPEMDAMEAEAEEEVEEEEEGAALGGKKRARVRAAGSQRAIIRCQVPGCEADIRELKGYHRRHRVCLRCANASYVVLDGEHKRYCQQCGKFHILPDFDEGKRSCRRKLERHNKRRRRRPNDGTNVVEKEEAQRDSSADNSFDDASNGISSEIFETVVSNKTVDTEKLESEDVHGSPPICSRLSVHNVQRNSIASFAASVGSQIDEITANTKSALSSCDNKSVYSSVCPTDRISFKLYDWNPAEFPRRLRHQIFQWLANMPVELEGYIRPGCTILTVFIAMPQFMWEKLSQEVAIYVTDLINAPDSLFLGRGNFLIHLSDKIIQVLKDGTSLMNITVKVKAPRLHYVYPTYFEAGKPMNFVACGNHLDQPKFRFLVSFGGKYLAHDSCQAISHGKIKSYAVNGVDTFHNSEHEMFKICITSTDPGAFGPAFIEVENVSGLSNFVPVLFGNKHICSELERMHKALSGSLPMTSNMSQIAANGSSPDTCKLLASKQSAMSELLLDIAWLLKDPQSKKNEIVLTSTRVLQLTSLLNFSMQHELVSILELIQDYVDNRINGVQMNKSVNMTSDANFALFLNCMSHAREFLSRRISHGLQSQLDSKDSVHRLTMPQSYINRDTIWTLPCTNHDVGRNKDSLVLTKTSASQGNDENSPLITKETIHSYCYSDVGVKWSREAWYSFLPRKGTGQHIAIFLVFSVVLCGAVCVALLHPHGPRDFAVSIRRCLFGGPLT